jgi:uncharacterized protein
MKSWKEIMFENIKTVIISIVLIAGVVIMSNTIIDRNSADETIDVTGLGSIDFKANLVTWSGSFAKSEKDLKVAYKLLADDMGKIKEFLRKNNVNESEYNFSSVSIQREFNTETDAVGNRKDVFSGYRLDQRLTIKSKDVEKIEKISRNITELINNGVEFNSEAPEYYNTNLTNVKMKLIESASVNARNRAKIIAEKSNCKLGRLKTAKLGVFQIIAQNSNEDYSWEGSYNTDSKNKTATITIRTQYGMKK